MNHFPRESGILLHISSLPGLYGIGEIGPEAFKLIDLLQQMDIHLWQILPLNDTGQTISPYDNLSAFALNPLLISVEALILDGYLTSREAEALKTLPESHVHFDALYKLKFNLLEKVCERFFNIADKDTINRYHEFVQWNTYWLDNYSIFKTLKKAHKGSHWKMWNIKPVQFDDGFLKENETSINQIRIQQFLFHEQWQKLKSYAQQKNIRIIGDIPIYVSYDSADVWSHQQLFKLNEHGEILYKSGCPPDYFMADGQVWGHPVYAWAEHRKDNYQWWMQRLKHLFEYVDIVRVDHFNGLVKYWEINAGDLHGKNGRWMKGPGTDFFDQAQKSIGRKPLIAEDLGEASATAAIVRKDFGIPGMTVLQMLFEHPEEIGQSLKILNDEINVLYTGTHDNDTLVGKFKTAYNGYGHDANNLHSLVNVKKILEYFHTTRENLHWEFIKLALRSKANTVIIPMQDILGLDSSARMNTPGTISGNWQWRLTKGQLNEEMKMKMKTLIKETDRI